MILCGVQQHLPNAVLRSLCFACIEVFIDSCCLVGLVKDLCCGHVISKEPISFWQTLAEKCLLHLPLSFASGCRTGGDALDVCRSELVAVCIFFTEHSPKPKVCPDEDLRRSQFLCGAAEGHELEFEACLHSLSRQREASVCGARSIHESSSVMSQSPLRPSESR